MSQRKRKNSAAVHENAVLHLDGIKSLQIAWVMGGLATFTGLILDPSSADWILGELIKLNTSLGRWVAWLPLLVFLGWLLLLIWGSRALMHSLRKFTGQPETVIMRPLPWVLPPSSRWIAVGFTLSGLLIAMILATRSEFPIEYTLRIAWVATAWGLAILMIGAGRRSNRTRLVGLGVFGMLLSIPILFLRLSFGVSASLMYGIWAVALTVSGTWALKQGMTRDFVT